MPLTLDGLTVVDLTQNIAGPYCTELLGDFGAAVIKIERPGTGEDARSFAPQWHGESVTYLAYNRNKKSVCIDLDDPRGREGPKNPLQAGLANPVPRTGVAHGCPAGVLNGMPKLTGRPFASVNPGKPNTAACCAVANWPVVSPLK